MTTLEEQKANIAELEAVARQANEAVSAARKAYNLARLEATGLLGHIVEFDKSYGYKGKIAPRRIVVERWARWGGGTSLEGRVIRKDGSLGTMTDYADISKLRDLGPWHAGA